jgi:signal transduction histidine kinase/CheY-like chemotaxis protein
LSDLPQPVRTDARIDAELYRSAYAADRRGALAGILAALFAASALQHRGAPVSVWIWAGGYVVLAVSRLVLLTQLRAAPVRWDSPRARAFRSWWLTLLTLSALIWGLGPPLFIAKDFATGGLLTGIWLAAAGLSAPLVAAARPAIYLWLLPAVAPLLFALALYGSGEALVLAIVGSVFLLVLLRLVLEQNDALAAGLAARFQNEDLVEQLRTQVEVAARANQEKTRFLASAVHDLRQPLHALGLFCAALDQRLHDIPERPLIKNMMASIEALETSFGAMLDISRLDAGVVRAAPQSFPVRDLFRRLYQQFGGDAEAHDISLRFRAARRLVLSDPQLLERVLANLLQNALRYTRQGGVLMAARRHASGVALEVWDTGVGIPAEKLELIFEEFYQIDNPERDRSRGLGMGLAIVRRLCNLLGHALEVRSTPGRGTIFRVVVPVGGAPDPTQPALEADTLPPRTDVRVTVMLIDDERAIREATRELLRPMRVDVLVAATIAEAVELARQAAAPIDMILSDWRLRGTETGVEAVRAVRRICGEATPAVLITGDTSADVLTLAHENGLIILHKPLQPRELVRLIGRLDR